MTNTTESEITKRAISKAEEFRKDAGNGESGKIICAAKKLIFEDHQSNDLDVSRADRLIAMQAAVKYIVEEVMELTPAEYDAIYSTTLNQKATLDHAIRKIVINAPTRIMTEALFDSKAILFRIIWPEYYAQKYSKPKPFDIFNATGELKGNLIRAGRIKELPTDNTVARVLNNGKFSSAKKERKRVNNHGKSVDKLVYWAMSSILPYFEIPTEELFLSLAKPKKAEWTDYGFVKIIEARGCYPSPLDFYMWNSPVEYQMEHVEEYMQAREKAKLKRIPALDAMYNAYQKSKDTIKYDFTLD